MNLPSPTLLALGFTAVLLIAFTKGAFGGGFAIVGIPLMSLVMDPISAGALLAVTALKLLWDGLRGYHLL